LFVPAVLSEMMDRDYIALHSGINPNFQVHTQESKFYFRQSNLPWNLGVFIIS